PVQAFLVRDAELGIDRGAFEVGGDPPLTDPFGDRVPFRRKLSARVVAVERRAVRIGERDADVLVTLFEAKPYAGQRAARPHGARKTVDAAFELLPNLRRGALDV